MDEAKPGALARIVHQRFPSPSLAKQPGAPYVAIAWKGCCGSLRRRPLIAVGLSRCWLGRERLDLRFAQPIATAMHFAPARHPTPDPALVPALSPHSRGTTGRQQGNSRGTIRRVSPIAIIRDPQVHYARWPRWGPTQRGTRELVLSTAKDVVKSLGFPGGRR